MIAKKWRFGVNLGGEAEEPFAVGLKTRDFEPQSRTLGGAAREADGAGGPEDGAVQAVLPRQDTPS